MMRVLVKALRAVRGGLAAGALCLWFVPACGSDEPHECGPELACQADELCVVTQTNAPALYECLPNPCEGDELTCECAASACAPFACGAAEDKTISCFCVAC
jgi:hypothetical protein